MSALWTKLNLKDQDLVVLLDAPDDLGETLSPPDGVKLAPKPPSKTAIPFAMAFVQDEAAIARAITLLDKSLSDDAVLWFAYPKKTSKRYTSAINRDAGWQALGDLGYEPVRQVAIDDDWSALRFRKAEHITKLTRNASMILSEQGRKRVAARSKGKS